MTSVAFLLTGDSIYNCGIKPFVDLAPALRKRNVATSFLSYSIRDTVVNALRRSDHTANILELSALGEAKRTLKSVAPDIVVTNDYIGTLKFARILLHDSGARLCVFVQTFRGLNLLNPRSIAGPSKVAALLPWPLVTHLYRNLLRQSDIVLANSETTGYILNHLYGITPAGVMYPPVSMDGVQLEAPASREGVFAYLGHPPDHHPRRSLFEDLAEIHKSNLGPVRCLVSDQRDNRASSVGLATHSELSRAELTRLISSARITYTPVGWEGFGYIGAESILCGTPVASDTFHPWLEHFPYESNMAKVLSPAVPLALQLSRMVEATLSPEVARTFVLRQYSPEAAADSLLRAIQDHAGPRSFQR